MKILAIGGCGSMGRYAVRTAQNFSSVEKIVIADMDKESAETFADIDLSSVEKQRPKYL